jgi:Sec-independent protein translocase protein TatA
MDIVHVIRAFKNAMHRLDNQFIDKDLIKENSELKKEVAYLRSTTEAVIDEMNELKKQLKKEKA